MVEKLQSAVRYGIVNAKRRGDYAAWRRAKREAAGLLFKSGGVSFEERCRKAGNFSHGTTLGRPVYEGDRQTCLCV